MPAYFSDLIHDLTRLAYKMNGTHWAIVAVLGVIGGYFCLRGFGSQLNA